MLVRAHRYQDWKIAGSIVKFKIAVCHGRPSKCGLVLIVMIRKALRVIVEP